MHTIPILNIEQFELKEPLTGFYSNNLNEHLKKNELIINKPHRHDFFLCVIFTKGSGIHEIDFDKYPITKGSVFFLKPGQTHSWEFNSTTEGYIFFHNLDFYEFYFSNRKITQFPFFYSYKNPPYITLTLDEIHIIVSRFKEINKVYHQNIPYKKQKLACLINLVYIDLTFYYSNFRPLKNVLSPTYLQTLGILEITIEEFYKIEKSSSFYANKLSITVKHLNRIAKATLNKTTTTLITDRVLLEAKRLIIHSNNTLSEISEILGYNDYAYFSRVFKLKTNKTPLQFKKSYQ